MASEDLTARLRVVGGGAFRSGLGGAIGAVRRLGTAATVAGAAAAAAGMQFNKTMDSQRVSFTVLLGSQRKAIAYMREIRKLSMKSPVLDPKTTGDAARTFIAYGINAKRALQYVEALGDQAVVSGKSIQEVMPRGAMAIGQIASKGKLSMEEMNQLAESVGLSQKRVRKELGMSRAEFAQTFTPGNAISSAKALPAILRAMEKQSGGAAEKLSKTTGGRLDQLREVFSMKMGALTRGTWNMVGKWAGGLTKRLKSFDPKAFLKRVSTFSRAVRAGFTMGKGSQTAGFSGFAGTLVKVGAAARTALGVIKDMAGGVKDLVVGFQQGKTWAVAVVAAIATLGTAYVTIRTAIAITKAWAAAQVLLNLAMTANPIGLIVMGVAALSGAFVVLYAKSKTFRDIIGTIGDVAVPVFKFIFNAIKLYLLTPIKAVIWAVKGILKIAPKIGDVFKGAAAIAKGAFNGIVEFFQDRINNLIDIINAALKAYNKIPLAPNIGLIGHVGGGGEGGGGGGSTGGGQSLLGQVTDTATKSRSAPPRLPHGNSASPAPRAGTSAVPIRGNRALIDHTTVVKLGRRELGRAMTTIVADDLAGG